MDKQTVIKKIKDVSFITVKNNSGMKIILSTFGSSFYDVIVPDKNNQLELSITHISFIALIIILLKCKQVPKRLAPKSLLILGVITYSIVIIISIVCSIIK